MESGQRECREIGKLLEQQLQNGVPPSKLIDQLQQSIVNTDAQSEFVCMYNRGGIELCHPNPALIGQKINDYNSKFFSNKDASPVPFNKVLQAGQANSGTRSFPAEMHRSSQIVNVYPVQGTDWMVAAHANTEVIQEEFSDLYKQFVIVILIMAILIIGGCYLLVRMIYGKYEKKAEAEIQQLDSKVNELTALNKQLLLSQEKLQEQAAVNIPVAEPVNYRKRIVTYQKDEMITLDVEDIALFYLAEATVFIKTFLNIQYTTNLSLDELMRQLDNTVFYRANRQFVININSIKTIQVYGNNQLRLVIKPEAPEDIVISKNKVAEFKKWLDR
ncbi:LytTR family DNA-binding domain-containing protein [Niastella koreensis]|nr:LytTR family DNA-binding domain-containing protein [Niastella koreensis]